MGALLLFPSPRIDSLLAIDQTLAIVVAAPFPLFDWLILYIGLGKESNGLAIPYEGMNR